MAIARAHLNRSQYHYPVSLYPSWVTRFYHQFPGQFLHQQIKRRRLQQKIGRYSAVAWTKLTAAYVSFIAPDGLLPSERLHGGRSPSTVPACKLKRGFRSVAEVCKVYRQVLAVATYSRLRRIFPFPTGTDCSTPNRSREPLVVRRGVRRSRTALAVKLVNRLCLLH